MRSSRIVVPLTLAALVLTGCGSNNDAAPRTSTVMVTVDATDAPTTGSTAQPSGGVTVPGVPGSTEGSAGTVPGSEVGTATATETATAPAVTETATTTEKPDEGDDFKKINPLKANCDKLLSVAKIKTATGKTVAAKNNRVVDIANPERKITGRLKCQFGVKGANAAVTVNLTQFKTAAAADAQIAVTKESEDDFGAEMSEGTVSGYPAQLALRDGGLIVFRYDTWTLSVVLGKTMGSNSQLPDALTELAEAALDKVLKK